MNAHIEDVKVAGTPDGPVPVVLLGVEGESELLPIFIGFEEATSIAHGVEAIDIGRPLTHDLLLDVVEALGGRIDRVVISAVEDGTYIADLHLSTPRGEEVIDARPSDALALVARTAGDIEVLEPVFESGRQAPEEFAEFRDISEVVE